MRRNQKSKRHQRAARLRWFYYKLRKAGQNKKVLPEHIAEARELGVSFDKIVEEVFKKKAG